MNRWYSFFNVALRGLLNFIFPPHCSACGRRLAASDPSRLCAQCLSSIQRVPEPVCEICGEPLRAGAPDQVLCTRCIAYAHHFGKARSLLSYRPRTGTGDDVLGSLLRRHKYGPNQALGAVLRELVIRDLALTENYDLVIPVPLHYRRLHWRGFNQAALLAAEIARQLRCELDATSLVRVTHTAPQTAQDLQSRRRNVHDAFAVQRPQRVAHQRVLLVDDVFTTGATADECARVLREAGASVVDVLTLARAL